LHHDSRSLILAATFSTEGKGWVLRDDSYTNPAWVEGFVKRYKNMISDLSRRDGLKQLQRQTRKIQ
jgi:hypothetical protein